MLLADLLQEYACLPEYSGVPIADVHQVSLFGDRPINIAATRGDIPELELLLMAGADINSRGEHGYTPLHNATEQGALEAAMWLISKGADIFVRSDWDWTPLDLAVGLGETQLVEVLGGLKS